MAFNSKAYYQANREHIIARSKAYYQANRERKLIWQNAYNQRTIETRRAYSRNRAASPVIKALRSDPAVKKAQAKVRRLQRLADPSVREREKAYYHANSKEILTKCSVFYQTNRERILARKKAHRAANPEHYKMLSQRYRARKRAGLAIPRRAGSADAVTLQRRG